MASQLLSYFFQEYTSFPQWGCLSPVKVGQGESNEAALKCLSGWMHLCLHACPCRSMQKEVVTVGFLTLAESFDSRCQIPCRRYRLYHKKISNPITVAQKHLGYYFVLPADMTSESSTITTLLMSFRGPFTSCWPREDGAALLSVSVGVNVTWTSHCKVPRKILEERYFQNLAALLG